MAGTSRETRNIETARRARGSNVRLGRSRRPIGLVVVLALVLAAAVVPMATAKPAAAATIDRIPTAQKLAPALAAMTGESSVALRHFKPYPCLGVFVHEVFIADNYVDIPGNVAGDLMALLLKGTIGRAGVKVMGKGDDRVGSSPTFDPRRTRAFIVLNFDTGEGYVVVSRSTGVLLTTVWEKEIAAQSFDARPVHAQFRNANNRVWADWVTPDTFRVRYSLTASGPGGAALFQSIDHQLLIDRKTGNVSFTGDAFPSTGTYQYLPSRAEPYQRNFQVEKTVDRLGDSPSFPYPEPVDATPSMAGCGGSTPPNRAPDARVTVTQTGPRTFRFDGSGSTDGDGSVSRYDWSFGDGTTATGSVVTHQYANPGQYGTTLTVTDNTGSRSSATASVRTSNATPGGLRILSPANGAVVGTNQPTLRAQATDIDGDRLEYEFHVVGPQVDISSGWVAGGSWTVPPSRLDPGQQYVWNVRVRDVWGATTGTVGAIFRVAMLPVATQIVETPSGQGYWMVASDGGVFTYGDAGFYGSVPGLGLHLTNIFGIARTVTGHGYWVVGRDGGVFSFGDAQFYGSMGGQHLNAPVVGMSPTPTGNGYWLVASDGGVFSFGDAQFYGSVGGQHLNGAVVSMAPTPSGHGYWLAASDGGVFSFGDAPFYGSMGGAHLNYPVTDLARTPSGAGYWMVAEDGGIFAFGDAQFYGSLAGHAVNGRIVSLSPTTDGGGYWLLGCDGGVFTFGNAPFYGSSPDYQCRGIWG